MGRFSASRQSNGRSVGASALKHVASVHTPTMLVHGENDNDVSIGENEQYYIALKDVGVETIFLRYPREGHGVHEPRHVID